MSTFLYLTVVWSLVPAILRICPTARTSSSMEVQIHRKETHWSNIRSKSKQLHSNPMEILRLPWLELLLFFALCFLEDSLRGIHLITHNRKYQVLLSLSPNVLGWCLHKFQILIFNIMYAFFKTWVSLFFKIIDSGNY